MNYVESETGEEKLDDLHTECSIQFTGKVIVPTKDVLSKIILTLNPTLKRKIKYKGKSKYIVYNLIKKEPCTDATTQLCVPENCKLTINHENQNYTKITFETKYIVNGESFSYDVVYMEDMSCLIQVLNHQINLLFPVKFNQNNVDGMMQVLNVLKVCKGILSKEHTATENTKENKLKTETWSSILDRDMNEAKCRSK